MPEPFVSSTTGRRSTPVWIVAGAVLAGLVLAVAPSRAAAQQRTQTKDIPLPPPPPGTKRIPLPPPPPGMTLRSRPTAAPEGEQCTGCHSRLAEGRILHGAMSKHACSACHLAVTSQAGKCKSRTSSKWALVKTEPELCYGCHARLDQKKFVHTVVRQGSCLSCHTAHSSNWAGRLRAPREQICFECHESDLLTSKPVKHAPVMEGRCLECHDAHGSSLPNHLRVDNGKELCLKCHDAKAPTGRGTPGPAFRIDLTKKFVHSAFKRTDCLGCHDGGHGSENLKMLKKPAVDLCYGCHERKDKAKYPHGAVVLGDCAVCHDPHSSDFPKRLTKATLREACFVCHQDDLTGRKVIHEPLVKKDCDECHAPHGSQNRNGLKFGEGKAGCYKCHKPVDTGKNKHAALERYGCAGCHDPHGTGRGAMLAQSVKTLCVACHPEQKDGAHVSPMGKHPVDGNLNDPRRAGRDFTCASCHNPHGSDNPRFFYFGTTAMGSCDGCHGDKSGEHPELQDLIPKSRRAAKPAATGTGSGAPAAGAGGAGSGGAGAGGGSGAGAGGGESSEGLGGMTR